MWVWRSLEGFFYATTADRTDREDLEYSALRNESPGWTFSPVTISMSSLPTATCMADFQGKGLSGLPANLGSCGYANSLPVATGIQDVFFATDTAQLYAGESIYYWVQYASGSNTAMLSGQGSFNGSSVGGTLNCVTVDGAACSWHINISAQ